ncbi:MAG: helix-turn-helix transcriptional regulator [Candidatus Aminicenantes bacterium]
MISKALVAASTKPIILSILMSGENYGYQIIKRVKQVSGGELQWSDGMLYPVLQRLEKEGYITSQWKLSEEGRHRKYYQITGTGVKELESDQRQWLKVHHALTRLWEPLPSFS